MVLVDILVHVKMLTLECHLVWIPLKMKAICAGLCDGNLGAYA